MRGYLPNGQRVRPTIGDWPDMSIAKARKAVVLTAGDLAKGNNPTEAKREAKAEREARKGMPTVTARLAQWREAKAGDWSPRYAAEVARLCTKIIEPGIGKQLLAETTRSTWADMITGERAPRPATATWLFSIASAFLNHAEALGWISSNPLPRKGLATWAPKAAHRSRVLTDDELVSVWHAVMGIAGQTTAPYVDFPGLFMSSSATSASLTNQAWAGSAFARAIFDSMLESTTVTQLQKNPAEYLQKDFAALMETMALAAGMKLESENRNVPTGLES